MKMLNEIDLCVVIPTFNRKKQLSALLTQLKEQKIKDIQFKIIVVVDGSTDGTIELLATEFPAVIVIKGEGNWWFTRSLNEGCKYAVNVLKAKLILTSNDDVRLSTNYLQNILNNYFACGTNSIIGSSSYSDSKPSVITFSGIKSMNYWTLKHYKYIHSFTPMEPGQLSGVAPSVTLPTRGMLIPSEVLKSVNFLDEKHLPQYSSDYDVVYRAAKKGTKVFVSYDAYLFEYLELTSQGNPRLTKNIGHFLRNIFFNKYSSNYFPKDLLMAWRHGIKLIFPFYFFKMFLAIPYIFIKYKFFINKQMQSKP